MKKLIAGAALVGVMVFTGISLVNAHGRYGDGPGRGDGYRGYGPGPGYGYCDEYRGCNRQPYNEEDREKVDAFRAETRETRKQLVVRKSELKALMKQENPDEKKVAALTGEIFDLRNLMDEKAEKTFGDNPPPLGLMGRGGGHGRYGMGPREF